LRSKHRAGCATFSLPGFPVGGSEPVALWKRGQDASTRYGLNKDTRSHCLLLEVADDYDRMAATIEKIITSKR